MNFKFSDNVEPLKPSAIREIFKSLTDPSVISFAAGNPSPLSFPVEKLRALADDIFETESAKVHFSTALPKGTLLFVSRWRHA